MGGLILGAILQYMVSASFSCFLWSVIKSVKQQIRKEFANISEVCWEKKVRQKEQNKGE